MPELEQDIDITVIKRNGKKVAFDGTKIAIAIKKGFDSVFKESPEYNYTEKDINKTYKNVLKRIKEHEKTSDKIKIEEIQDYIELELKNNGYDDIYKAFHIYRENRKRSRELFFNEKKQHKFIKIIENLGMENTGEEQIKIHGVKRPESLMKEYGSAVSEEFAKAYLIKPKFSEAHEEGDIYIHHLDYIPTGSTVNIQIDLEKIFEQGFVNAGVHIRKPQSIMSYSALTIMVINAISKEQSGTQTIPAFDHFFAKGVLKTFKKEFKREIFSLLEFTEFDQFVAVNGIERELNRLETIDFNIEIFFQYVRESKQLQRLLRQAYEKALDNTKSQTTQALEAFIHNINITDNEKGSITSVNLGTDTSKEGRLITKLFLRACDKGIASDMKLEKPFIVFKVKKGINLDKEDTNYDLLEMAHNLAKQGKNISFLFLDAKYNLDKYVKGDFATEACSSSDRTRVLDNMIDPKKAVSFSRGNIAITTINLPRIGIKNRNVKNKEKFFEDLDEVMEIAKDQLLEQFEIQCDKRKDFFPMLLNENVWMDGDRLKQEDRTRRALKQGNFSIGFIGLDQCLKALFAKTEPRGKKENNLGIEIIKFMRKKCDEFTKTYNLNFTLLGTTNDNIAEEFLKLDRSIYGSIKGITDKRYENSFFITENIPQEEKIKQEAPYHELCNGGHEIILDKKAITKQEDFIQLLHKLIANNIGLLSFN